MSITFGKTRADNFGRVFEKNPRILTRNPYLNYLRFYKKQHPRYGLKRILKQGSKTWRNLKPKDQLKYTQKHVLSNTEDVVHPQLVWPSTTSRTHLLPDNRVLMDYTKRSLNSDKNVKRSWRNVKRLPRYGKKKSVHYSDSTFWTSDQEIEDSLKDILDKMDDDIDDDDID